MNKNPNFITTSPMTRRGLLGTLAAFGSACAMIPLRALFAQTEPSRFGSAIVSFHMDQPYLDWSGTAQPYHPPPGARSADVAAQLSEEMLRRHCLSA